MTRASNQPGSQAEKQAGKRRCNQKAGVCTSLPQITLPRVPERHSPAAYGIVSKRACREAKADGIVDVNDRELGSEDEAIDSDPPLAISRTRRISHTQSQVHYCIEMFRPLGKFRKRP